MIIIDNTEIENKLQIVLDYILSKKEKEDRSLELEEIRKSILEEIKKSAHKENE